jgi:hypothetical protein
MAAQNQTPDSDVNAVVSLITFLGQAYQLGKSLIGKKFSFLNFGTDIALVNIAQEGIGFVGTLPQVEAELAGSMTPAQLTQISDAIVGLGLLKPGSDQAQAVADGLVLADQIKTYVEKYF